MGSDQRLKPLANERCNIMRFTVWKWLFRICHEQFLLLLLPQILFLSDGQVTHTMVSYVKHYTMAPSESMAHTGKIRGMKESDRCVTFRKIL